MDGYQPVYRYEEDLKQANTSRTCLDRCELLATELAADIKNVRILDVGCSMGYISLYLADRGATVTGVDYLPANIDFCRQLAKTASIKAEFKEQEFSKVSDDLVEGQYDVALIFSVLHHVVHLHGLAATRKMMATFLDKCDAIYVELARKSENVDFAWLQSLPENELDIFAGIKDIEITKLAELPALNGVVTRPLYRVRKTAKLYNGLNHSPLSLRRSNIKTGSTKDRKYVLSDTLFTKLFVFEGRDTYLKFCAELDAGKRMGHSRGFLPVIGSEIRGRLGAVTWPRVNGPTLMDAISSGAEINIRAVALDILDILRGFANAGLYWNDLRSHNIMLTERGTIAIDLEVAAPTELDATLNIYLWLLLDIQERRLNSQVLNIFKDGAKNVKKPPYAVDQYDQSIRDIAAAALGESSILGLLKHKFV